MPTFMNRWVQGLVLLAACLFATTVALFYWTMNREVELEQEEMWKHFQHVVTDITALQEALLWAADIEEFNKLPPAPSPVRLERFHHAIDPSLEAYLVTHIVTGLTHQLTFPSRGDDLSNRKEAEAISTFTRLILARFLTRLGRFEMGAVPINLFDLNNVRRVAFGCALPILDEVPSSQQSCDYTDEQLSRLMRSRKKNVNRVVFWSGLRGESGKNGLVAFARINEPSLFLQGDWWAAISLTFRDMPQFPHVVGGHGHFPASYEIHSPEGELLTAAIQAPQPLIPGLGFLRDASVVEFSNNDGWKIRYRLSYVDVFRELYPQLVALGLFLLVGCLVAFLFSRWYFKRHYLPAVEQRRRTIESEEFARGVIEVAQVAMCVVDRHTCEPLKVNTLARQWLGDDEELRSLARDWVTLYAANGTEMRTVSLTIKNRHFSGCFAHARYEDHDALLCTLSDISAHVQEQESLAWAKRVADQSSAAKSAFLAMMSHEIRTPLYGVLGTLELLSETGLSAEQKSYLKTTQSSAAILLRIIGDVLDMSKIESGVIELNQAAFSPAILTETIAQAYAAAAVNKALSFHCVISPAVPKEVLGDEDRVRQVLSNLVSNAIKFTEIGRIRLSLEARSACGGHTELIWCVSDSGIGISSADQSRLFEPFFQVRSEPGMASGTGLGLAICKSLVDLMGGAMDVASKVGDGSTFSVFLELPLVNDDIAVLPARPLPTMDVLVRAPTVELRRHYRQWLERWGVRCDSEEFASPATQDRVLLNVSPELMAPLRWPGRQIVATERGPLQPQWLSGAVCVSSHSLAALAEALALVLDGPQGERGQSECAVAGPGPRAMLDMSPLDVRFPRTLGLRVLLAEDSAINQEVLERQLKVLGCSVVVRGDGAGALKAWSEGEFDVLLTDINMPGIGGPELIRRLRHAGMDKPIICVTANAQVHLRSAAEYSEVDAWIVKPITLRTLQDCLQRTVANRYRGDAGGVRVVRQDDSGVDHIDGEIPSFLHGIFQASMAADVAIIHRCLEEGDEGGLKAAIHRVHGGLVMAGLEKMAQQWQAEEERMETGMPLEDDDVGRVHAIVNALEMLLNRLRVKAP